jgi:hypothetical protein
MGRADLIGNGKQHLVPTWQPAGTGEQSEGHRGQKPQKPKPKPHTPPRRRMEPGTALTQHTGLPPSPGSGE